VAGVGFIASINVSDGGIPKLPRDSVSVRMSGLEGDRQRRPFHGGPAKAVCLYSLELIRALQAEGHPIAPGTIGENLTIAGIPWRSMTPGVWVEVGTVSMELTSYADPCRTIEESFRRREIGRVSAKLHPGWSRIYARVVNEGTIAVGNTVVIR
jgi:MOSC domain-containing protein YiiM